MANGGKVKRYLLFSAFSVLERKTYAGSFQSLEEALAEAAALKTRPAGRWQVMDSQTLEVVAENPGIDGQPLETFATVDG